MRTSKLYKGGSLLISLVSVVTFSFAGFASQALAATATIENTGPDSENTIRYNNEVDCDISNTNTVDFENDVDQNAETGDATVSGNTVGSGWSDWDPVGWQNRGYSYEQWHAAFTAYMSANAASMRASWGNMSGGGGSAHSGDASNSNVTDFSVDIDNGGSAGAAGGICGLDGDSGHGGTPGTPGTSGSQSGGNAGGAVLGANSGVGPQGSIMGGSGGIAGGVHGSTGVSGSSHGSPANGGRATQTSGGTGGSGNGGTPNQPGTGGSDGGDSATISNTGPDSYNAITNHNTYEANITNTTTINTSSWVVQNASTGDATTAQNSGAGSAGSGDAGNTNGTNGGVSVQN